MAHWLAAIPHAPVFNASLRVILILVQFHGGRVWDGVVKRSLVLDIHGLVEGRGIHAGSPVRLQLVLLNHLE